jgi:hypothetical protein
MSISTGPTRVFAILTTATMLAGCAAAGTQLAPAPSKPSQETLATATSRAGSWMSPAAKQIDLLYVSDVSASVVDVYAFGSGKRVGRLKGFSKPHGQCVDKAGDVFITDSGAGQILEYAHGGSMPLQTLADPGNFPHGCSVDPKTGDLAVTNLPPDDVSSGSVSVYRHAQGTAKNYRIANFAFYYFPGYDPSGNLFVDGTDDRANFLFAELAARTKKFFAVTLDHTFNFPAAVQWDGTHLAVGDQVSLNGPSTVYEFSISGTTGTQVGATSLGSSCDVIQFFIQDATLIAPNLCSPNVMYFDYPAGGGPTKTIGTKLQPAGVSVSLKEPAS